MADLTCDGNGEITLSKIVAEVNVKLESVQAGVNTTVDNTDPLNPIVTADPKIATRSVEYFLADGNTTVFPLANLYEVGKETLVDVIVGGVEYDIEDEYSLSDGDTLTFVNAPSENTKIKIKILGA